MKKRYSKLTLYQKLLIILFSFTLVPLMLFSVFGYHSFSKVLIEMIADSNLQTLKQVRADSEDVYDDLSNILTIVSIHPEVQRIIKEDPVNGWQAYNDARFFSDFSSLLLVGHPEIIRVTVYNFKNKRVDSLGRFIPLRKEDKVVQELKEQLKNRLIATSSIQKGVLGQPFISFGRQITDLKTGKPIGLAVVDFDLKYLNEEIKKIKFLKSGHVMVVDQNHQVIYHPNMKIGKSILEKDIPLQFPEPYLLKENEKGKKSLYIKTTMSSPHWTFIGVLPYDEVLEKLLSIFNKFFIFIALMLVAIFFVAVFLQKLFVKPIRKLQLMMSRVQKGDFSARVNFKRNDEIGRLGHNFNGMVTKIEDLIERVYQVELNESRALLFQKQAELDALQEKITPHFLYNTLNSISWVANRKGIREIEVVVSSLSSLLRYSLGDPSKLVTLKDEFDYLMLYGEIIDFRYDGDIEIIFNMDNSVANTVIPRLTLQPIVENVIKHAFEDNVTNKWIKVSAFKTDNIVIIDIEDNGKGISQETLSEIDRKLNQPVRTLVDRISETKNISIKKS